MRIIISFAVFVFITGCSQRDMSNKVEQFVHLLNPENMTDPDSIKDYLLFSAAKDFHQQQKIEPVDFKEVRFGRKSNAGENSLYLMCGQFAIKTPNGDTTWNSFTTIKTSAYEQYLGGNYCNDSIIQWRNEDLTAELIEIYEMQ